MKRIVLAALAPITASLRGDARPRSWRWTPWIQVAYLSCLLFTGHLATEARRVGRLVGVTSGDFQDSSRAASAVALAGACLILTSFLAGVRPSSGPARVIWILEFALILAVPALLQ